MHVDWGVIPVAGRGTRMQPLSRAVPKELLPLGRKPVVQHVIEELVAAGLRNLVFVTSADKPAIRDLLGDTAYWREQLGRLTSADVRLHVVEQKRQIGLGDAVLQARSIVGQRPFVVALGDCVIGGDQSGGLIQRMLQHAGPSPLGAVIALEQVPADEVSKYGIARTEGAGDSLAVLDLIEKPPIDAAPSRWAIAGRYVLGSSIFQFLERTELGRGGEVQLTDAIRGMIQAGGNVVGIPLRSNEHRCDVGEFGPYFAAFAKFAAEDQSQRPSLPRSGTRQSSGASAPNSGEFGHGENLRSGTRQSSGASAPNSGEFGYKRGTLATGRAFARAGLLGNPSDGYGGKTISCILANWVAMVQLTPSDKLCFCAGDGEPVEFENAAHFERTIRRQGYYGGLRLMQAAAKRFFDFYGDRIQGRVENFNATYKTDIPRQLGLGGSSAIVIATMRALSAFYQVPLDSEWLPSLALSAETQELGIPAGLQDRVIQTYEGLMYMDFSAKASTTEQGLTKGHYERLDAGLLPQLYVAITVNASEPTEVLHSDLRKRFERGDTDVVRAIGRFAEFAERGRDAILNRDFRRLGELMNANFDLRRSICKILPEHQQMIDVARSVGASAKFCGSGGAIVGICQDEDMFARLQQAFSAIGASVVHPHIGIWHDSLLSS